MDTDRKSVAFIGLGNLGFPIARNLVAAGYALRVYDLRRDSPAVRELTGSGAVFAAEPAELLGGAAFVVTLLPTSDDVLDTYLDKGFIRHLAPGARCLELSSGYPAETVRLGKAIREAGASLIDAPICNGGVPGAYARQLVHLVGGEAADFEACRDLLGVSARQVIHVGPLGTGHALKAVNNSVAATCSAAAAEGLALAAACGLDPREAMRIFVECSINQKPVERLADLVARGPSDAVSFRTALQRKDLRYAARLAAELGVPHPIADAAHQVILGVERAGHGDADSSQGPLRAYGLLDSLGAPAEAPAGA